MQKYSEAIRAAADAGRADWAQVQRWIERFICGTSALQGVVGRRDHPDGGKVTQAQFDAGEKIAHVCPFVRDSIDNDLFYIEESPLTSPLQIRKLVLSRADDFIRAEPAFDPIAQGRAATMPVALKTMLIWFPNYQSEKPGADKKVDQIFKWMITEFIRKGLMLGQFYRGCAEASVHNPPWRKVLTAPYLAFALRYMQPHDKLFIPADTPGFPIYQKMFAGHEH
ncbi:MAG TPA: hypothetical protein VER17_09220 [Tepidisphaeraceae bacterium]|nr:hypothetical protein [Tepidisphaeraceae bacterium]